MALGAGLGSNDEIDDDDDDDYNNYHHDNGSTRRSKNGCESYCMATMYWEAAFSQVNLFVHFKRQILPRDGFKILALLKLRGLPPPSL